MGGLILVDIGGFDSCSFSTVTFLWLSYESYDCSRVNQRIQLWKIANFKTIYMDAIFSSIIKMAGVNPLHKTFYVMILWGYSLAILYTICFFRFMQTFLGVKPWHFIVTCVWKKYVDFFPRPDCFCSKIYFKPCVCLIMCV